MLQMFRSVLFSFLSIRKKERKEGRFEVFVASAPQPKKVQEPMRKRETERKKDARRISHTHAEMSSSVCSELITSSERSYARRKKGQSGKIRRSHHQLSGTLHYALRRTLRYVFEHTLHRTFQRMLQRTECMPHRALHCTVNHIVHRTIRRIIHRIIGNLMLKKS